MVTMATNPAPIIEATPSAPDSGEEIGRLLVSNGALTDEQLRYARRIRAKLQSGKPLLAVLRELGYVEDASINVVLRENRNSVRLGALLVELGHLTDAELRTALEIQRSSPERRKLGEVLVERRFVEERRMMEVLSQQLGFTLIDPEPSLVEPGLMHRVNSRWCQQNVMVPLRSADGSPVVAVTDPLDARTRALVKEAFGADLPLAIATRRSILDTLATVERGDMHNDARADTVSIENGGIVALAEAIIHEALEAGASDIHIEPTKEMVRVRMRCDGVLVAGREIEKRFATALASRIKIVSGIDISEKRRHQDGRMQFEDTVTGQRCDIRVSVFATLHGQKIVMRLLSRKATLIDIRVTGMAPRMLERFLQDALDIPSGVILITGPTGSGKTTTLYGAINYLNTHDTSIVTAEDPVEYVVEGISQCSINPAINLTFEETLRHMVRQDPDIIVLGEIRDRFSADTAIQAALTGHKVLTTFHTEDSIGGLLRLMNMDIEAFLISSTVVSVVAQRLVRRVCEACAEPYQPGPLELRRLGFTGSELAGAAFRLGKGCPLCRYSGYKGRVGVFELLVLNEQLKEALLARRTSTEIRRISVETSGLVTLLEDGLVKAAQGQTSLAEIIRYMPRLERARPLADLKRILGVA